MSEYAELFIGKLSLYSFRNYLDSDIVSKLFNKKDLIINDPDDENALPCTQYIYRTTVLRAKERLDAQGYTLSALEKIFNEHRNQALDYSAFLSHLKIDYDEYDTKMKERIEKYNITFQKWRNATKKIISYELVNGNIDRHCNASLNDVGITTECDKVIFYSLKDNDFDSFYAIHTNVIDSAYICRLILDCCNDAEELVLDFTYLQNWDDDCIPNALTATECIRKTIVLVEGTSDKDILEFAISQFYPHLSDLFYFMDFDDENGKRDGGTTFVIKNLKTFYFSKIDLNFIAIFDNDAEGYQSKCTLMNDIKNWPSNFRILLYPNVDLLHKYPTIAPNGTIIDDDINKKAASIELYLPDNLISDDNGYFPIEWESRKKIKSNGIEEALYQGVISHKDKIKHSFHALKNDILHKKALFVRESWGRMKALLDSIIFAYK